MWCNPLEIVNSVTVQVFSFNMCARKFRSKFAAQFLFVVPASCLVSFHFMPLCCFVFYFSHPLLIHEILLKYKILYVSYKLLYIFQELCRTLKNVKLEIRCIWILVPEIHTFLIALPQRALNLFLIISRLFRDLCPPDLTETSPWNVHCVLCLIFYLS